jgi:hypothetical protein
MNAKINNLRIEDRMIELTGEVALCFVFDFNIRANNWTDIHDLAVLGLKRAVPAALSRLGSRRQTMVRQGGTSGDSHQTIQQLRGDALRGWRKVRRYFESGGIDGRQTH